MDRPTITISVESKTKPEVENTIAAGKPSTEVTGDIQRLFISHGGKTQIGIDIWPDGSLRISDYGNLGIKCEQVGTWTWRMLAENPWPTSSREEDENMNEPKTTEDENTTSKDVGRVLGDRWMKPE